MAGVGFSLRALGQHETLSGLARMYTVAGILSSGPWLISMLTQLFVGVVGRELVEEPLVIQRFQVCVTWLFAASLILTCPLQLLFTRYAADLLYRGHTELTTPSLTGALSVSSVMSALAVCGLWPLFSGEPLILKLLLGTALVALCNVWMATVMLTSLREYGQVLGSFALGYSVTFVGTMALARYGEAGLLAGFVLGQVTLLVRSLAVLARLAPAGMAIHWGFLERSKVYPDLLLVGFFLSASTWVDKLLFWLDPSSSYAVVGPLRASELYDLPIFLAYLTIVPGMSVFLLRVETDYAERHAAFYRAILEGAPLTQIEHLRDHLTAAARRAVIDIVKAQAITLTVCFLWGPQLLSLFELSELHLPLFYIDAVAVSMQVLLLAVISIFFYLDRRRAVLGLTSLLFVANAAGTLATQHLGVAYYGFGFATATTLTCIVGVTMLTEAFRHLVRDTFMLQRASA